MNMRMPKGSKARTKWLERKPSNANDGIRRPIFPQDEVIRPITAEKRSSRASIIAMMKPTNFRDFNNPSSVGQLDLSGLRRILVQSEMTATVVIIAEIGSKSCPKRFLVDRNNVIETLPADRSNQTLDIGTLPGGSWGSKHLLNSQFV